MFLQPIVVGSSLVPNIWVSACGPRDFKRQRKTFLAVSGLVFADNEVGEVSKAGSEGSESW